MAVENAPKYQEWSTALDALKEANDRFREGQKNNLPDLEARRRDLHKAQEAFGQISKEVR